MGNNDKSRIILTMSAAVALALEKIEILKAFSDETPDKEVEKDVEQKSEKLNYETRRYYLDLKQNVSCELRKPKRAISYNVCMSRSQMVIPGEGIGELLATLRELIDKYSSEYLDEHISPANLQRLNGFAVKAARCSTRLIYYCKTVKQASAPRSPFDLFVGEIPRGSARSSTALKKLMELQNNSSYDYKIFPFFR